MADGNETDWQARITALPTQADIENCKEIWPHDWREKHAFFNGQVAALLNEHARQREQLEAAWRANERLEAENEWLRGCKAVPASEAVSGDGQEDSEQMEREAREAAMREIVDAVADGGTIYYAAHEGTFCVLCDGYVPGNVAVPDYDVALFPHGADCPVTKAQAVRDAHAAK